MSQARPRRNADDDLLTLALSRPSSALEKARRILHGRAGSEERARAHQAIGVVLRDRGELADGIRHLRQAVRIAEVAGLTGPRWDAQASLGVALALEGRTRAGERCLAEAAAAVRGKALARILVRWGGLLGALDRHEDAIAQLSRAVQILHRQNDQLWEARALQSRSLSHLARGAVRQAEGDLARAERLFDELGQELEVAFARHNRGVLASRAGAIPRALEHFARAEELYQRLDAPLDELLIDRAAALHAAGLSAEAAETLLPLTDRCRGARTPLLVGQATLIASAACLDAGDAEVARDLSARAAGALKIHDRPGLLSRAILIGIGARRQTGAPPRALLRQARTVAEDLAARRDPVATSALVLAGELAGQAGLRDEASRLFERASRARTGQETPLTASARWVARALRHRERNRPADMLRACERSLELIEEQMATYGGSELRTYVSTHGRTSTTLALREARRRNDPRLAFYWSERWRAVSLATPPVNPPEDQGLARDLAALRETAARFASAQSTGGPTAHLAREVARLERAARDRVRAVSTAGTGRTSVPSPATLTKSLNGGRLIELAEIDGELIAITIDRNGVRLTAVGSAHAAEREVRHAHFVLRRLARDTPAGTLAQTLPELGRRLEAALLGAARPDGEEPVVIVPPARFQAAPWGMLPALRPRPLTITPSAALWQRASSATSRTQHGLTVIGGPQLPGAAREVAAVARRRPDANVLRGSAATTERVMEAIDGTAIAHIAAHGTFRADNPLFSSLLLADGALTVLDLQRLRRAPRTLLLTSCDSGVSAAIGGSELLGLSAAMLAMGTRSILASITPVNDRETTRLALAVHDALATTESLALALATARLKLGEHSATAAAFLSIGA